MMMAGGEQFVDIQSLIIHASGSPEFLSIGAMIDL
jgi:hypothetical protein